MTRPCEVVEGAVVYELAQLQIRKTQAARDGRLTRVRINKSTVDEFTILTESFMDRLVQRLKRLTEVQRRRVANRVDVALLLDEGIVDMDGLCQSYNDCMLVQKLAKTNVKRQAQRDTVALLGGKLEVAIPLEPEVDLGWLDKVTKRKVTRDYIPKYMPQLPPEYTWKATPRFTERVKDPRVLREQLVVEGRLGEKALEHIVANESVEPIESPIYEDVSSDSSESEVEEVKMVNGQGNFGFDEEEDDSDEEDVEFLNGHPRPRKKHKEEPKFDLAEFATNRIRMLEKKREQEERRISKRTNNEMAQWGKTLGAYTPANDIPDALAHQMTTFKRKKYLQLVSGLQKQERKCAQWMQTQQEKRRALDAERTKLHGASEIQVGLPAPPQDGANPPDAETITFLDSVAVDEELEFDMDFSDVEDLPMA